MKDNNNTHPEISIILPCRNEQEALPFCLRQIKEVIKKHQLSAEIIVSDSSTDKSPEIAKKENVILVTHNLEGYGRAYLEAFKHAKGTYIVMADADYTYDFREIPKFLRSLKNGSELVIGNRLDGNIEKGAMPWANRYLGTPFLSFLIKIFFGLYVRDSQSGMRAIRKTSLEKMNFCTTGMEFASEMIIQAIKQGMRIEEIPIHYYRRRGKSKLKPFSDAYKHVRFMLLYSPLFLFFIPGFLLLAVGVASMVWIYSGNAKIFQIAFFYHPLFLSSLLIITGYQIIIFSAFSKIYAITHLGEKSETFETFFKYVTLERALATGVIVIVAGAAIFAVILFEWIQSGFDSLNEVKKAIVALTLITVGTQTFFSSFMLSILGIKEK